MPVVAVSTGSHSHSKEVAQRVARKLGFECNPRDALVKPSRKLNFLGVKLLGSISHGSHCPDRFSFDKE